MGKKIENLVDEGFRVSLVERGLSSEVCKFIFPTLSAA